jgi:hypothetical protein
MINDDSRQFCPDWQDYFPWVFHIPFKNVMMCKLCTKHNQKNRFAREGSQRFKIDGLIGHCRTSQHQNSMNLELASTQFKTKIDALWASVNTDLIKLLHHVKFVCEHNLPISFFANLCKHLQKSGHIYKNSLYMSHYGFMELCQASSTILKGAILDKVKKSPYYSLIIDESTDLVSTKELALMIRYFDHTENRGVTRFLCLLPLEHGDAKYLRILIIQVLRAYNIIIENMVGISTDGAAVMIGPKSGLCTRLAKRAPFIVQNHCVAHRLNLAFKDTEDDLRVEDQLDDLIKALYRFFKKSPSKCLDLERYARLRKKQAFKLLKIYDVRWLSKFNAISNVYKNLEVLLDLLKDYSSMHKYECFTTVYVHLNRFLDCL